MRWARGAILTGKGDAWILTEFISHKGTEATGEEHWEGESRRYKRQADGDRARIAICGNAINSCRKSVTW
jgi:hypothetical protein